MRGIITAIALTLGSTLTATVSAQSPVAIDTAAARQLVEMWKQQPADSMLACLEGHTNGPIVEVVAVRLATACGREGDVGAMEFLANEHQYTQEEVLRQYARVLEVRTDLLVVGAVYGAEPVNYGGSRVWAPRVWAAVRMPEAGAQ